MTDQLSSADLQLASVKFVSWLHSRVLAAGRGDNTDQLNTEPRGTFWLGRLAPEATVQASKLGARGERLDPCAVGLRVRPARPAPWVFDVRVGFTCWVKDSGGGHRKTTRIERVVSVTIDATATAMSAGADSLCTALQALGLPDHGAAVRIEVENWHSHPELIVTLVNEGIDSPRSGPDTHLYESVLEISGLPLVDFELEALPDSFRYDRRLAAIGVNCGVELTDGGLRTTDVVETDRGRPTYWTIAEPPPDMSFEALSADPLPEIDKLSAALSAWGQVNWNPEALTRRGAGWSEDMRREADEAAAQFAHELARLHRGAEALRNDPLLLRAFQLANEAMGHAARGRYTGWRAFQLGFLISAVVGLIEAEDADVVDTVWFATGGGKTETYLGLLVTSVLYDRLTGKAKGISAWSRFPLRMLSLQQTQRFADALAGAELARRRDKVGGAPIRLGFFVGQGGTPNAIPLEPKEGEPDSTDPAMPGRYQVLLRCPFCHGNEIEMDFDRRSWTLRHKCLNQACPWPETGLPFHVVDQEIYRFLPAVVVGTLDKAAMIGMQSAMRGFVGPPLGICDREGHGYCYAPRKATPSGCLVPGCRGQRVALHQPRERWAPTLRLQDELHLLRDSLGAVDSHYESVLDHLQTALGGRRAKVVASSATLTGFDRQVDVLYQRHGRVFPQQGPSARDSFWSAETDQLARRFVAVAPRGVTLEFVSDRTITVLQESVRLLLTQPNQVCFEAGIPTAAVQHLLNNYGVNVIYGNTVRDVEAARRSVDTQVPFKVNAEMLTGGTPFEEVRRTLDRLDKPEHEFEERIHVIAASSMLSHGVDIDRLNSMVMLGLPLTTAEFIQTSARVGRQWPGLVYVLHRIGRERELATFKQFDKFVTHGDRFVEPVPITRRSRRVLALTTSGLVEARRLNLHEPASGERLTTVRKLRDHYQLAGITASAEATALSKALGFDGPLEQLLQEDLASWLRTYFTALDDPATTTIWPNQLSPTGSVMRSLRDVEESAPVVGDD